MLSAAGRRQKKKSKLQESPLQALQEGCEDTALKGKALKQVLAPGKQERRDTGGTTLLRAAGARCSAATAAAHSPQEAPDLGRSHAVQPQYLAGRPPPAQPGEEPRRPRQQHRPVGPQLRFAHADGHVGARPLRQQPTGNAPLPPCPPAPGRPGAAPRPAPPPTCRGPAGAARPAPPSAAAAPPPPGRGPSAQRRHRSAPCAGSRSAPRPARRSGGDAGRELTDGPLAATTPKGRPALLTKTSGTAPAFPPTPAPPGAQGPPPTAARETRGAGCGAFPAPSQGGVASSSLHQ